MVRRNFAYLPYLYFLTVHYHYNPSTADNLLRMSGTLLSTPQTPFSSFFPALVSTYNPTTPPCLIDTPIILLPLQNCLLLLCCHLLSMRCLGNSLAFLFGHDASGVFHLSSSMFTAMLSNASFLICRLLVLHHVHRGLLTHHALRATSPSCIRSGWARRPR
jgi:hypothetical protein